MEHVRSDKPSSEGCLFEPSMAGAFSKKELVLYRDTNTICLLNRFPYANGHLLVAPIKHAACLTELTETELANVMNLVRKATEILRTHLRTDGFNIGLNIGTDAGAGIADHIHFHIVPRWRGDHNFMTVVSEIRTIPEHIQRTFEILLPDFQTHYKNNVIP